MHMHMYMCMRMHMHMHICMCIVVSVVFRLNEQPINAHVVCEIYICFSSPLSSLPDIGNSAGPVLCQCSPCLFPKRRCPASSKRRCRRATRTSMHRRSTSSATLVSPSLAAGGQCWTSSRLPEENGSRSDRWPTGRGGCCGRRDDHMYFVKSFTL
jgi:hypothetical protein